MRMRQIGGNSELERAMRRLPSATPESLIEGLAEELGELVESGPPVDMNLLASAQGIREVRQVLSGRHSGCLINHGNGLRIEVSALDSIERQNFTIGHEICHTLLPGFSIERNYRCSPGRSTPRPDTQLDVEWLADVGASELLLPRRHLRDLFASRPFGWETISDISRRCRASLEATARRYVRLSEAPAIFARLEFATSRSNLTPELRVRSASWSPSLDIFIPRNKSLPKAHPVFRAASGECIDEVVDLAPLRAPGAYRVAARPFPYSREGEQIMRVLLLGHPTQHQPARTR